MGPLIPPFWTSSDVCPGFQRQGRSLAWFLTCVILRFTSGVTCADCIEHSISAEMCLQALVEVRARPGFKPMTVHAACSKHSAVNYSATPAQLENSIS